MNRLALYLCVFILTTLFAGVSVAQSHKGISFQGVIKLPSGEFPTRSGVTVNARILSPNSCILREEQFTGVNLSNGYINIAIGTGAVGGNDPGLTLRQAMDNSAIIANGPSRPSGLACLNIDGTVNSGVTSFDPSMGSGIRKFRLSLYVDAVPIVADFNMRSMAFAINSETLDGKSKDNFIQVSAEITQARLEQFISNMVSASGNSIKWDGSSFVAYNPNNGSNLTSIPDTAILALSYSKLTSIPSNLSEIAGLSCADGKILKKVSGIWSCADEVGSISESDPTVQSFAQNTPGAGLTIVSNQIVANFGTSAGTVAAGNDSRFTDSRNPMGAAGGDLGGNYPDPSVVRIQSRAIDSALPIDGQVLLWDNGNNTWKPQYVRMQDVRNQWGGMQMIPSVSCTSGQAMIWSSIVDQFSCQDITGLDAGDISTGVLATARLGTGTASGTEYLAGDGTWKTFPTVGTGDITNGGNSPAGELVIGTNNMNSLQIEINNTRAATFSGSGLVIGNQSSGVLGLHSKVGGPTQGTFESTDSAGGIRIINSSGVSFGVTTTSSASFYPDYLSINKVGTSYADGILINSSNKIGFGGVPSEAKINLNGEMTFEGISTPTNSTSSMAKLYFNSSTKKMMISEGATGYVEIVPSSIPVAKISGLATSATTDTTNASNITSGTLDAARLPASISSSLWSSSGSDIYRASGNVGVGEPNPSQALDVNGAVKALELMGAWDSSGLKYIRLGDLQVAWGVTSVIADGSSQSITFPVAFNEVPTVIISSTYRVNYNCSTGSTTTDSRTLTGFDAHVEAGANNKCNWVAIGRWR